MRRAARKALGAVSPRLVMRVQEARFRAQYQREPDRGPRRLQLETTTACNYRCLMCTDHSSLLPTSVRARHMSWERIESLLRVAAAMGTEEAWFAGRGEPLVHPQATEIVALASSLGLKTMITTNGGLLSEASADALCDAGLTQLSVSINSETPETYAHIHGAPASERERILKVIRRISLRPVPPRLCASMVVLQPNVHEVMGFVKDAIAAGVPQINLLGLRWGEECFPTLMLEDEESLRPQLEAARTVARHAGVTLGLHGLPEPEGAPGEPIEWPFWRLGCFVGHQFTRVDVDGILEGCCSCGNHLAELAASSFEEAWRSPAYQAFREACRNMPRTKRMPPNCNCAACGNAIDNDYAYQQMGLT